MGLKVDTSTVPPPERFDYWSSSASQVIHPMALHRDDPQVFSGKMHVSRIGDVSIYHIAGSPLTVTRTANLIRTLDPGQLNLVDLIRGSCRVSQQERASALSPGELSAHSTSRPYTFASDTPFELLLFGVPGYLLGHEADRIFASTATSVNPRSSEAGRLGQDFLRRLAAGAESGQVPADAPGMSECIAALTRSMYANVAVDPLNDHTQTLFPQVIAYIDAHLAESDLSSQSVAKAHFISVRSLQQLFQAQGTTVAGYIRNRRLEQCRRSLADPRDRAMSIARIARRWGIADAPNFSRQFRVEFGESPRDYRARVADGSQPDLSGCAADLSKSEPGRA